MKPTHRVTIEKLVFGGQGLGHIDDGQVIFAWNTLPGEEVEVDVVKKKKTHLEAVAKTILKPSPDRIDPQDNAFLSTSPWQIMTPECEARWKRNIAAETYSKIGNLILSPEQLELVSDERMYGYRNKMEFSFTETPSPSATLREALPRDNPFLAEEESIPPSLSRRGLGGGGHVQLAFFQRGKHHKISVDGSSLAKTKVNATARHILAWINAQNIPLRSLKSLIIRTSSHSFPSEREGSALPAFDLNSSRRAGKQEVSCIAALFIKDELMFDIYPTITDELTGFQLYYSTHKSPAAVPTKLLYETGTTEITATIKSCQLFFDPLSFFQINVPMFERALEDIAAFLDPKEPIIDYYGGVGAISLPLSLNRPSCTIVDSSEDSIEFAKKNIAHNARQAEAICAPSEELHDLLDSKKTIIVDPPRAGLHPKFIQRILIRKPPKIIYLSCGIDTQARDIRLLSEGYKPIFIKLYNFFPRTPHIEGLVILERL